MSRSRSPNYPSIDLGAAIEAVAPVFAKEKRNKMPRVVLAKHLGYSGLNGRALTLIGALRSYGLVEGTGDDMRVSDDGIILLNAPDDSEERQQALERCSSNPSLFQDLRSRFLDTPSEAVLKYTLVKMNFTPEAAGKAAEAYLATMTLVGQTNSSQNSPIMKEEHSPTPDGSEVPSSQRFAAFFEKKKMPTDSYFVPDSGIRKEVITLDEGDVVITFPENLSSASFADLEDHLNLFIRKMQRRTAPTPSVQQSPVDMDSSEE